MPPLSGNFREQQRKNARYRDSVTDKQLNAPAYVESGKNKLIQGAEVLSYFQNRTNNRGNRPALSEEEIIGLIIDPKAARQAIKEGKITPQERNALMRQAGRRLQQFDNDQVGVKRENQSRAQIVTDAELDRLDSQGQGRDQSEMMDGEYKLSGKSADNSAYYQQERYMEDELSLPDIQGFARAEYNIPPTLAGRSIPGWMSDKKIRENDRNTEALFVKSARERPPIQGPAKPGSSNRGGLVFPRRRENTNYGFGNDYTNIAVAPASATRGTTAQQITAAALADKAARDERAAMREEVKALIKADAERQPALGKFAQMLNSSSASARREIINDINSMMPPEQNYVNSPGQAVRLTRDGRTVGYADETLSRYLGDITQADPVVPAQASLTYPQQQRMTEDQYRAAYGNMDAQSFVDIYSAQSQPGNFQDTTLHTTNFVNKMKEQGLGSVVGNMGNVRSVNEVDVLLNRIRSELQAGADLGNFFLAKPATGKTNRTQMYTEPQNIGMAELTDRLGYETPEKVGLAMALQQMEMARMTRVNQQAKDAYMSRQAIQGPVRPGFYQGAEASMDDFAKSGLEYQRSTNSALNNLLKAQGVTDKTIGALASDPRNMNRMNTISHRVFPSKNPERKGQGRDRQEIIQNTINNEIMNRGKAIREGQPDRGRAKFEAAMDRAELSAMESEFTQGRADEGNRQLSERMSQQIEDMPPSLRRTDRTKRPFRSEY